MSLYSFLRDSTIIDLACLSLVLFSSFVLTIAAIAFLVATKRRKPLYVFIVLALFPLIIALAGATFRYVRSERLLAEYAEGVGPEWVAEHQARHRAEFLTTTVLGVAGAALPLGIGLGGLLLKNKEASPVG